MSSKSDGRRPSLILLFQMRLVRLLLMRLFSGQATINEVGIEITITNEVGLLLLMRLVRIRTARPLIWRGN